MERPVGARLSQTWEERPLKLQLSDGFDPSRARDKDKMRAMLLMLLFILSVTYI